jgi:hypothetical protein
MRCIAPEVAMRPMMIALVMMLATVTTAWAGKKAGVTMPDTVVVADKQLVLNGMGLREATFLNIDVYVAGLYVEKVSSNPAKLIATDQVKLLVLRFVRDVDRSDITDAWSSGFKNNSTVPVAQLKPLIDQLNRWMPAFKDGDTLAFTFVPGEGVAVDINGNRKGMIKGDDFARSLFSIWLGPKPPNGALKRGLLGKHPEESS